MPKAYGYCRASTGRQDLTFDVQRASIQKYYESKLQPEGVEWGGFYEDKDVSGGDPFSERPKGRELFVIAQKGDAIIWSKMDRAFRSVQDGASTFNLLRTKGIAVHSLDIQLDTSTPMGSFVCHLLMLLGELERSWISSRTQDALAARRARGLPMGNYWPPGWKVTGVKKERQLVPDQKERELLDQVHREFVGGKTIEAISNALFFKGLKRTNHTKSTQYDREWLTYGLFARAKGYPMNYPLHEWRRECKGAVKGKLAAADLRSRLSQLEGSSS